MARTTAEDREIKRLFEFVERNQERPTHLLTDRSDWMDTAIRSRAAHEALTFNLTGDDEEHALRIAFDFFGLNPMDPYHWRFLLSALAYGKFGKRRRAGRPPGTKKWTEAKRLQLAKQIGMIVTFCSERHYRIPDKKTMANWIEEAFPEDYRQGERDQIYRQILDLFSQASAKK